MSVIDLEAAVRFYEMRDEICRMLTLCSHVNELHHSDDMALEELINKIESLGKKEDKNARE